MSENNSQDAMIQQQVEPPSPETTQEPVPTVSDPGDVGVWDNPTEPSVPPVSHEPVPTVSDPGDVGVWDNPTRPTEAAPSTTTTLPVPEVTASLPASPAEAATPTVPDSVVTAQAPTVESRATEEIPMLNPAESQSVVGQPVAEVAVPEKQVDTTAVEPTAGLLAGIGGTIAAGLAVIGIRRRNAKRAANSRPTSKAE